MVEGKRLDISRASSDWVVMEAFMKPIPGIGGREVSVNFIFRFGEGGVYLRIHPRC